MNINRRSVLAGIPLLAVLVKSSPAKLPEGKDIIQSFDARDWARDFVAHIKAKPAIALDEETMTTWFANALMRGYDEKSRIVDAEVRSAGKERLEQFTEQALTEAVAQGWCHPANSSKPMDCELAQAIVDRLMELKA